MKWGRCLSEANLISSQLIHECFNVMTVLAFLQPLNHQPQTVNFWIRGPRLVSTNQYQVGTGTRELSGHLLLKAML